LPIHKSSMKVIILRNGHLTLEGDETTEELRTALLNLRKHTYPECHRPGLGTPIESLLPDVSVLAESRTRIRNAQTVATSKERL
jgi:hypothetical protein